MRKILILLALLLLMNLVKAQYVTIPDTNFVSWLQTNYPACMIGNQMDTTCVGIQNETILDVTSQNIYNLTGVQYFINLIYLNCNSNHLTSLPLLPDSLIALHCLNNNLTSLPSLSNSLKILSCSMNSITTIPSLPNKMTNLNCSDNPLISLPTLPDSLQSLYCYNVQLLSLPTLPPLLALLWCQNNQLSSLPPLPNSLTEFDCSYNLLTNLPTLPDSLQKLYFYHNQITNLPSLPNTLKVIFCYSNLLTSLPSLPNSIETIRCSYNQLTSLPNLPNLLTQLVCDHNNISCFPVFPNSIYNYFNISNNPFTCLPNYVIGMDQVTLAYPLCIDNDLTNNPNSCPHAFGIIGKTYKDNNNNCIMNIGDQGYNNVHLKLYDSFNNLLSQTYSFSNGLYNFVDSVGTYIVKLDTAGVPYTAQCFSPGVDSTVVLTIVNPLVTDVNFDINCKPSFDVGVQSVICSGLVFPGIQHCLNIVAGDMSNWYNLNCASGINGQIQVTVSGPVTYNGIASGALTPSISGNVFTYNIPDFGIINMQQDFKLLFTTDTTAHIGDTICVNVFVNPTTI